jgi:hypothetical protein
MGEEDEVSREQLAKDVLTLAALAEMPDTFWVSDERIGRATSVLEWTAEQARDWAQVQVAQP